MRPCRTAAGTMVRLHRLRRPRRWTPSRCSSSCARRSAAAAQVHEGARATWRAQAERMWPVSAERPLQRRPGLKGAIAYPVKRLLRPLLRWYVEPLAAEQRAFNDAVLKLVDDLYEAADRAQAGDESSRRALVELEERLRRVERRGAGAAPAPTATVAAQPAAAAVPDYFAFEARMRGSTAAVRERQRPYVDDFRDAGSGARHRLRARRVPVVAARGRCRGARCRRRRRHGRVRRRARGSRSSRRTPWPTSRLSTTARSGASSPRRSSSTCLRRRSSGCSSSRRRSSGRAASSSPRRSTRSRRSRCAATSPTSRTRSRSSPRRSCCSRSRRGSAEVETRLRERAEERLAVPDDPLIAGNVRRLNELLFGPLDYAIVART